MAKATAKKTLEAIYKAIEKNADEGTFVYKQIIRHGNRWIVLYSVKCTATEYLIAVVKKMPDGTLFMEEDLHVSTRGEDY